MSLIDSLNGREKITEMTIVVLHSRDVGGYWLFQGTNEVLRLYIAINCLQFAGAEIREVVK